MATEVRARMTRDELHKLAQSRTFVHRLTRDDLGDIIELLDTADANVRIAELGQRERATDLADDVRAAAGTLMARVEALSAVLERS